MAAEFRDIESADIQLAADKIACGFIWAATPQGHEYWATVHHNLIAMLGQESSFPLTLGERNRG